MTTLLLTISGPSCRLDLAVRGDIPLADVIPGLIETDLVGFDASTSGPWMLARSSGEPLDSDRSLTASGVVDGQVLVLRPAVVRLEAGVGAGEPKADLAVVPANRPARTFPRGPTAWERATGRRGRHIARLDAAIQDVPIRRCVTIAVVSPKGGVGKSTVSVLLGTLFARLRAECVTEVDADSDYGSLGRWLAPTHAISVNELAAELERPGYLSGDVLSHLAVGPEGLRICPAPRNPAAMAALDRDRYFRLLNRLKDTVGVLILDCGTGLGQPGVQAAILASDQVVIVSDSDRATLSHVADAANLLRHAGAPIVAVVNRARPNFNGAAGAATLFPYTSALHTISDEPAAARALSRNDFSWASAPRSWEREVRDLGATLVSGWPQLRISEVAARS